MLGPHAARCTDGEPVKLMCRILHIRKWSGGKVQYGVQLYPIPHFLVPAKFSYGVQLFPIRRGGLVWSHHQPMLRFEQHADNDFEEEV